MCMASCSATPAKIELSKRTRAYSEPLLDSDGNPTPKTRGAKTVLFTKQVNGTYYVVEALAYTNPNGEGSSLNAETALMATPENAASSPSGDTSAANTSIAQGGGTVNGETSPQNTATPRSKVRALANDAAKWSRPWRRA